MADKEVRLIDAELLTTNIAQIAKNCARSDAQKALIGRILFMIENMPTVEAEPVNGWISVTDEMPKLGQRVMAFCRAGILTFLRYDGEVWFEMSSRNEYLLSFVTHWQPLPKPPKGE